MARGMALDFHTANLFRLVRAAADKHVRLDASLVPKPWREASEAYPTVRVDYLGAGLDVPAEDDDTPVRPLLARWYIAANNALAPFYDDPTAWESPEQGRQSIREAFGRYLPEPAVAWPDGGVELTELWARQGFGAQRLERVAPGGPPDEAYVSSFEFLTKYPVRSGLLPFGGEVFLDRNGKATRARYLGEAFRPGDAGWDHATFAYRTSSLVWGTFDDHVCRTHYVLMNGQVLATKRRLALAHPLRSFLAPFHYRTAAINNGGTLTLVPKGGVFHRAAGFDWPTLQQTYSDCIAGYRYETFAQGCRRRGLTAEEVGPDFATLFPYASDGLEYWTRVRAFVEDAFERSPALQSATTTHGDATKRWWDDQAAALPGGLPAYGPEALRDLVAMAVFTGSGYHEHVGNVAPYVANPPVAGGKIRAGQVMADRQVSMQYGVLACITGLPMPKLMEDFGHLMPDDAARDAHGAFKASLADWQVEVDARNAGRSLQFHSFSPRTMSCSVSI